MSAPRFSEVIKADIVRRFAAGETSRVIAALYGCDVSYPSRLHNRKTGTCLTSDEKSKRYWSRRSLQTDNAQ